MNFMIKLGFQNIKGKHELFIKLFWERNEFISTSYFILKLNYM